MGKSRRTLTATGLTTVTAAALAITACGASGHRAQPRHPSRPSHATATPTTRETSLKLSASPVALPSTPAGDQARWLLGAHAPIPTAQLRAHFAPAFLAKIGPSQLNAGLTKVLAAGTPTVTQIAFNAPTQLSATITAASARLSLNLVVNTHGLIDYLDLTRAPLIPAAPSSWAAVDARLRAVAPDVRMVAAGVNGSSCQTVHAIDASTPAPLGSAFKLFVLAELAHEIQAHRLSWNTPLTVTQGVKSLPSGVLQNAPDGTRISVLDTAAHMISISDNTAANMLIKAVGRGPLQASLKGDGMARPQLDTPFLTTRELFILKLRDWPALADRYLHASRAGRQALLTHVVDRQPLPGTAAIKRWSGPRDINSIEWFASPDDICRVLATLHGLSQRPGLSDIDRVMQINNAGLPLDPSQWSSTWFKGGSEPGVLTLSYLATSRSGRSYVVSVLASNPRKAINETTAIPQMLSAIQGAFTLAARGRGWGLRRTGTDSPRELPR